MLMRSCFRVLLLVVLMFTMTASLAPLQAAAASSHAPPRVLERAAPPAPSLLDGYLQPVPLGHSLDHPRSASQSWGLRLLGVAMDSDTELEIRDSQPPAAELANGLVNARIQFRHAKRGVGFGIGGLILGPLLVVLGLIFAVTVVGLIAGLIFIIWGAVWTVIALPVLIGSAIAAPIHKARIIELEERLKMKGSLRRPLPAAHPLLALTLPF